MKSKYTVYGIIASILAISVILIIALSEPQIKLLNTLTTYDPLISSGEIDNDELQRSIEILRDQAHQLQNAKNLAEIGSLYPYNFLLSIADTSTATQLFQNSPTIFTAKLLIAALEKSSTEYLKHVTNRTDILHRILKKSNDPTKLTQTPIIYPNRNMITSPSVLLHDNTLAMVNALQLQKEVRRRSCLLTNNISCVDDKIISSIQALLSILAPSRIPSATISRLKNILPVEILFPTLYQNVTALKGPYNIRTFCFNDNSDITYEAFYLAETTDKHGTRVAIPKLATNTFYIERAPRFGELLQHELKSPYYRFLDSQQWEMFYQLETTVYICPSIEHIFTTFSYANNGTGQDLSGLPAALRFIAEWGLEFTTKFATAQKPSGNNPQEALFMLATKSPFSINYFNHTPAIWRINNQPQYLDRSIKISRDLSLTTFTSFRDLAKREGIEHAKQKTASLKTQSWWLEQYINYLQKSTTRDE